ncbi:MAG TPA: histidine kinase [Steroidobacteraceae bacterium]
MDSNERPYRYARRVAWLTWLLVGVPELADNLLRGVGSMSTNNWLWLFAYLAFGPTLYVSARVRFPVWLQLARLSVATLAPLFMVYVEPHSFACTLWVIAAWELAIALPLRIMLPWTVLLSLAMTALLARGLPLRYAFQEVAIFCAFQGYAILTAYVAASEAKLRQRLAVANAELHSTQTLLAHSIRSGERMRISRELHDLMGHHLSALVLNLEVARHTGEDWRPHVFKAQDIARQLLTDVRNVTKLLRGDQYADIRPVIEQIVADIPQIRIHLKLPEQMPLDDARLAQTMLRVVQESVTNAIKHSECANLWVDVDCNGEMLEINAKDDGRGARDLRWGAGLTGMRERLEEIGGSLKVITDSGTGFWLQAWLPVKPAIS